MTKVVILGSSGMLGSTLSRLLGSREVEIVEVNRTGVAVDSRNQVVKFDLDKDSLSELFESIKSIDYCINAIGLIRQLIDDKSSEALRNAVKVNTDFPIKLSKVSSELGIRVIQIATDCVFAGTEGRYSESSPHDPTDIYGKTKSAGEQASFDSMNIRCSIIGRELSTSNSLLNWFLGRGSNSKIEGYTNHFWNGVTTFHFGRVVSGVINTNNFQVGTFHLVPKDSVSKFELLKLFGKFFNRQDIEIREASTKVTIDRTLTTNFPEENERLWLGAGYQVPPTIETMVIEYAEWEANNQAHPKEV
jgi:dTDP-4-dehydrorhamnose reductase